MSIVKQVVLLSAIDKYGTEVSDSAWITSPAGWVQLMKMKDAANRQVLVTMDLDCTATRWRSCLSCCGEGDSAS